MSYPNLPAHIRRLAVALTLVVTTAAGLVPIAAAQNSRFNALDALGITVNAESPKGEAAVTSSPFTSAQTSARLMAWAPNGLTAGGTIWLGLQISHQPHWHTYWRNSGDSGLPTALAWTLPADWTAGDLQWPTPKKFQLGPLANYGFDGTVLLPTPVTIGTLRDVSDPVSIKLAANWLVCKTECIPEEAAFELSLATVTSGAILNRHAPTFKDALARAPRESNDLKVTARAHADDPSQLQWTVTGLPAAWQDQSLELFPETTGLIAPGSPWTASWNTTEPGKWVAVTPINPFRSEAPQTFNTVVALADIADGQPAPQGIASNVRFEGEWPPMAKPVEINPALAAALEAAANGSGGANAKIDTSLAGWLLALVGAFLGGVLLNLMPCVFPVLALKVLAFAESSGAETRAHRLNGLSYTAGVVSSFGLLGATLLALRGAGDLLGWGFQLQDPWLVGALSVLFTFIALNLLGIFEIGNWLPQSLGNVRATNPTTDAFLSGVLATAVASPCTAPFMGASLGLAIALPTAQGLSVFAAVGLGMASPYLLASWVPAVGRRLPRPGAWMVTFKQLMAFPMMATVIWLLWVFGQQTSLDSAAALLLWLLSIAWLLWSWAQPGSSKARSVWRGIGLLVFAAASWLFSNPLVHQGNDAPVTAGAASGAGGTDAASPTGAWLPWTNERVGRSLAEGYPVFVDFTAAWCVTCQVNKATTLTVPAIRDAFNSKGVVTLQADWTRRNPDITGALNALGRNGVPTYALYAPGATPVVLSELITPGDVTRVLADLPNRPLDENR